MKRLLMYIFSLVVSLMVVAQTEHLFTANGDLVSSSITALAQDSLGNIWLGTERGLNRYDGAKFTSFTQDNKNEYSLTSNNVTDLYVTPDGVLIVGTRCGLQSYDADFNRFEDIVFLMDGDTILPHVASISMIDDGPLFVGTLGKGIYLVDLQSKTTKEVSEKSRQNMFISNIAAGEGNTIWIGSALEGAFLGEWKDGKLAITLIPGSEQWKIEDIKIDSEGNAYFAMQDGVYKVFKGGQRSKKVIDYRAEKTLSLLLVQDNLLRGTEGAGLLGFDLKTGKCSGQAFNTGRYNLSGAKVRTMMVDRDNNLWLGLPLRGVLMCAGGSNQFEYIGRGSATRDIIGDGPVWVVYAAPDGALWVVVEPDGLYRIKGNDIKLYTHAATNLPLVISNVFQASDGTVWICSIDAGMARMDLATGYCTYVPELDGKSVFDIVEDANHKLWVGTMGNGLLRTDMQGNVEYQAPYTDDRHYSPGSDLLNNCWINSLTINEDGTKVFINTCYGVGCYDIRAGSFVNTFGENRILAGEMCNDSYLASDGSLWIGTNSGVYRWHKNEDEIQHFDTENGLCSNSIVGVRGDDAGNIWFATGFGLSKFDPQTGEFTNYFAQDGLQGNEFSLRSMSKAKDGTIYAGGLGGVTAFNSNNLTIINPKAPELRIADVYLHDSPIDFSTESGGREVIQRKKNGELEYQFSIYDNSISVELTTNQFNNRSIRYQYSIDGAPWQSLMAGSQKVHFSNIHPGRHKFAFKAVLCKCLQDKGMGGL